MTPSHTDLAIHAYFDDAWTYGLVDFETVDCAFFKVNAADQAAFPELAGIYGVKLTAQTFATYADASAYVQAVAEEAR